MERMLWSQSDIQLSSLTFPPSLLPDKISYHRGMMFANDISLERQGLPIMSCVIYFSREHPAVTLGLACPLFCGLHSDSLLFGPFTPKDRDKCGTIGNGDGFQAFLSASFSFFFCFIFSPVQQCIILFEN